MTCGFPKEGDVLFTTEAPMGNAAVVGLSEGFALGACPWRITELGREGLNLTDVTSCMASLYVIHFNGAPYFDEAPDCAYRKCYPVRMPLKSAIFKKLKRKHH
jgi:hypothetical protein